MKTLPSDRAVRKAGTGPALGSMLDRAVGPRRAHAPLRKAGKSPVRVPVRVPPWDRTPPTILPRKRTQPL
jgi:hypothetical protein